MGTPDRENYQMAPQNDRDVEKAKQVEEEETGGWTGLSKEELLVAADTPAWNWTRNVLLILFWVTWVAMLIAAIWIVVTVPRCPDVEWWQKNVVYQVEPRSFFDSDNDGVGDLNGIEQKLSYLDEIKVKVLYINSIFKQANDTNNMYPGNHIVDFQDVDESIGSVDDLKSLIGAATEASIKVVLEFIPSHSSDQHPWFKESKANATSPMADFYIWSDNPGSEMSAWTKVEGRGWYYHSMDPSLPDLNFENKDLRKKITDAMNFWLEIGIDGMVVTNVDGLVEDVDGSSSRRRRQTTNETATATEAPAASVGSPSLAVTNAPATNAPATNAPATNAPAANAPATEKIAEPSSEPEPTVTYGKPKDQVIQDLIDEWREVFTANSYLGKYRLLLTSGADDIQSAVSQYGNKDRYLADFPLNMQFLDMIFGTPTGEEIGAFITSWMDAKEAVDEDTEFRWNSWMLSDHGKQRVAKRCSADLVNALNTLLLTLRGTPIVMYGEELGMQGNSDQMSSELAPMSWGSGDNASFTKGTPWKNLDTNWKTNNVEMLGKDSKSSLNIFKALVDIHLEPPVVAGSFDLIAEDKGIAYLRRLEDWPTHLVVINFSDTEAEFEFPSDRVPVESEVVLSTDGAFSGKLNAQEITVAAKQAVIFKFKPLQ